MPGNLVEQLKRVQCDKGCANCCTTGCPLLTQERTCAAHPTIVGEKVAARERGILCHSIPLRVFSFGYFCPPIIRILEAETGAVAQERIKADGTHVIANQDEFFGATRAVRGLA